MTLTSHDFKVHDSDNNGFWSFAYDGNPMGNEQPNPNLENGTPVGSAERHCNQDSMFAEFRSLEKCHGEGCGWTDFNDLSLWKDTDSGVDDYDFCKINDRAFDVRNTC
ncbi:MAG: hypothetical protein ACRDK3_18025 [Actinomycetota bacterium]